MHQHNDVCVVGRCGGREEGVRRKSEVCVFVFCLFHLEQAADKNFLKQEAASPQGE